MGERRYTRILLRAEHLETALWDRTPGHPNTSIDYDELGLSENLVARLEAWNEQFAASALDEETLNAPEQREDFTAQGAALATALRAEVGDDIEVLYLDGFQDPTATPATATSDAPDGYRWSANDDDR